MKILETLYFSFLKDFLFAYKFRNYLLLKLNYLLKRKRNLQVIYMIMHLCYITL